VSSNSPTRPYGGHLKSPVTTDFNALRVPRRSPTVDELSSAMRGMVVEDSHNLQRQSALNLSRKFPPSNQMIYSSIPQSDCTSSYQNILFDKPSSYDLYRPNSDPPAYSSPTGISGSPALIYPNISPLDSYYQSGFMYEFPTNLRHPASQYIYQSQAMAYGHTGTSPYVTSQVIQPDSLSVVDKIDVQASCLNESKRIV